jgi:hypothetical protein
LEVEVNTFNALEE